MVKYITLYWRHVLLLFVLESWNVPQWVIFFHCEAASSKGDSDVLHVNLCLSCPWFWVPTPLLLLLHECWIGRKAYNFKWCIIPFFSALFHLPVSAKFEIFISTEQLNLISANTVNITLYTHMNKTNHSCESHFLSFKEALACRCVVLWAI